MWLVLRRGLGAGAELKMCLCNAPAATPEPTLVWLVGMRWPVEQAIKEGKDELGLDHYEVRGWVGWHHHLTMTLLAQHFLMRLRCRLGGIAPALTVPQVRGLLAVTLPARPADADTPLALVLEIQRRHAAAARSHRQRTLHRLRDVLSQVTF